MGLIRPALNQGVIGIILGGIGVQRSCNGTIRGAPLAWTDDADRRRNRWPYSSSGRTPSFIGSSAPFPNSRRGLPRSICANSPCCPPFTRNERRSLVPVLSLETKARHGRPATY